MDHELPASDRQSDAADQRAAADSPATSAATDTEGVESEIDAAAVRAAIRIHGERVKQRELRQAMNRLDAEESLTPAQRRILREMATEIVDSVLASPAAALADTDDAATLRTAVELFDPND